MPVGSDTVALGTELVDLVAEFFFADAGADEIAFDLFEETEGFGLGV